MVLLSLTFRHHHQSIGINRNDYFYTLSFLTHFSFILLKYLDYSAASDRPRRATKYQFYMNSKTVRSYTFRNVTFTVSNSSMTLWRNIIAQSELALTPRSEMREVWRKYRRNKLCRAEILSRGDIGPKTQYPSGDWLTRRRKIWKVWRDVWRKLILFVRVALKLNTLYWHEI